MTCVMVQPIISHRRVRSWLRENVDGRGFINSCPEIESPGRTISIVAFIIGVWAAAFHLCYGSEHDVKETQVIPPSSVVSENLPPVASKPLKCVRWDDNVDVHLVDSLNKLDVISPDLLLERTVRELSHLMEDTRMLVVMHSLGSIKREIGKIIRQFSIANNCCLDGCEHIEEIEYLDRKSNRLFAELDDRVNDGVTRAYDSIAERRCEKLKDRYFEIRDIIDGYGESESGSEFNDF